MTKLYNILKGSRIYGEQLDDGTPIVIIFDHLDGMYSYCYLEHDHSKLVHLSASTPLKVHKDGYKIVEKQRND